MSPEKSEDLPQGSSSEASKDRPLDPEKLLRLASVARAVYEDARADSKQMPAEQLASLYKRVENQIREALPNSLISELDQLALDAPFSDGATDEEVRVAFSGLIGWVGGLFQGLQAAIAARGVQQLQPPETPSPDKEVPGRYL